MRSGALAQSTNADRQRSAWPERRLVTDATDSKSVSPASEFALVSVRRAKLERSASGSRGARAALRLLNNPTLFISATQLGITLASLALGWIGEPTVAALLQPFASSIAPSGRAGYVAHVMAIVVAFFAITFLHIVLGE